mgnify:CR=1
MKERLLIVLATIALGLVVVLSPSTGAIARAEGNSAPAPQFSGCQGGDHCGG